MEDVVTSSKAPKPLSMGDKLTFSDAMVVTKPVVIPSSMPFPTISPNPASSAASMSFKRTSTVVTGAPLGSPILDSGTPNPLISSPSTICKTVMWGEPFPSKDPPKANPDPVFLSKPGRLNRNPKIAPSSIKSFPQAAKLSGLTTGTAFNKAKPRATEASPPRTRWPKVLARVDCAAPVAARSTVKENALLSENTVIWVDSSHPPS